MVATSTVLLDKTQVLDSLKKLPDPISASSLIEHILFMQSVVRGIQQAELGHTTPHVQAMQEIRAWKK